MNKYITLSASTAILSGLFLIAGCSSSDGGGSTTATVPANATVIDATNAEQVIIAVASSLSSLESSLDQALAVETTPAMGLREALDLVKPRIKNSLKNSGIDPVTGAEYSESYTCIDGGTWSVSGVDSFNETTSTYTDSFNATFNQCSEYGVIIDGSLSGTFTENESTYDYTDNVTGSLSVTVVTNTDTVKVSFTKLAFQENGNNSDGTYTTTKATFALAVVVNDSTQLAFLTELTAPIVESTGTGCPESGTIKVTGGNNTTAEGIFNSDGTLTINANGSFVKTAPTCYG